MSVEYKGGIYFGIFIDEEDYNRLTDEERDCFVHRADSYYDNGDIILGIRLDACEAGEYSPLYLDYLNTFLMSNTYQTLIGLYEKYKFNKDSMGFYFGVEVY